MISGSGPRNPWLAWRKSLTASCPLLPGTFSMVARSSVLLAADSRTVLDEPRRALRRRFETPAGLDQVGRRTRIDDGRSVDHHAARQRGGIVDRSFDRALRAGKVTAA